MTAVSILEETHSRNRETLEPTWGNQAACVNHPEVDFFPLPEAPEGDRPRAGDPAVREAMAICFTCPVQVRCQLYAFHTRSVGVWGAYLIHSDRKGRTSSIPSKPGLSPRRCMRDIEKLLGFAPKPLTEAQLKNKFGRAYSLSWIQTALQVLQQNGRIVSEPYLATTRYSLAG